MKRAIFAKFLEIHSQEIEEIALLAIDLHKKVGQFYDKNLPYGYHLSMVAENVMKYGHLVIPVEADIMPVVFGAYFHDSIEDARQTYNDVNGIAQKFMQANQAYLATEIVYALTNDKGRTRSERAGEHYYEGIRETPYASFVKLCDRVANMTYSFKVSEDIHNHMQDVYKSEWEHFIKSISSDKEDIRYSIPAEMLEYIEELFNTEN